MPTGRGFLDKLSRGWTFLRESLAMWAADPHLFLPSLFCVLSSLAFLAACYFVLQSTGLWDKVTGQDGKSDAWWWLLSVPVALIAYVITYFFTGMTVHLVDKHLRGVDASLSEAWADSTKNIWALIYLAGASVVVDIVASVVRGRGSMLREAASEVVEHAWQAATYLVLPVIIIEDMPIKDAFTRAWDLHNRRLTDVVVAEVGVSLVEQVLGFIVFILIAGQGMLLYTASPALLPVAIAIAAVLLTAMMAVGMYIRTAYYTCLYLWAAATEAAQQPVAAPAPLAPAVA